MKKLKISKQDVIDIVKKRWWVMLIEVVALVLLILADQLSKLYVVRFLLGQPGQKYVLIDGVLTLIYSENTGAGFGMFKGNTIALTVVTLIVMFAVTVYLIFAQKQSEWLRASLIMIVAGGVGNAIDRLGYVGQGGVKCVRDFIDYTFLKDFAICNVADVFVTVGAVMLVIVLIVMMVQESKKSKKEFEEEQAKNGASADENLVDPLDAPINLNPMMKSENDYTFVPSDKPISNSTEADSDSKAKDGVSKNDTTKDRADV